ncbi:MAG TPA: TetR/AcrR family transcriptional regulator [Allosphingosinicella sp.]|nr:TetR/AcrR family transcriptional regulator [Allosphingosinicella sp.]
MVQKSSAAQGAPRGRPRSFDTDVVLDRVRDTFLRYGYAGTSMDQLSAATGLHKPSLYGAFGDKKKLYLAALDNYLADVRAEFAEAFAVPDLFESLEAMTEWSIDKFMGKDEAGPGCFMMHTAMPEATEDPEISRAVRESMDSLDRALVRRFERATEAGQISPDADPRSLAMVMVANHYEISGRARAGYTRAELRALSDRAIALVKAMSGLARAG